MARPVPGASSRPTLRDVASVAGVSIKTVSRVVNGESGVRAHKVEAVRRAVAELGYRTDVGASSLRRADGRTAAVGAILQDLANPFSAAVHRALEDAAREHDMIVFAGSVDEDPERERRLVRAFTGRRADGLVVVPASAEHSHLAQEVGEHTPVVFVDRLPAGFPADAVVTDNVEGAAAAVAHLAAGGHRRIAFLGDLTSISTARARHEGYCLAMQRLGLPVGEDVVVQDLHEQQAVERTVRALFRLRTPPTALFTAQNYVTVAAVRTLQALGLEQRVALVGFDDFPLAELVRPGVTVIAQDPDEIGRRAAAILFARLDGDDRPPRVDVVPTRLVVRGSGEIPPPATVRAV